MSSVRAALCAWTVLAALPAGAGEDRVARARERSGPAIRAAFAAAKVAYPAPELFLRAFKEEGQLELWAAPRRGARMVLVRTFRVCARSGGPGPKQRRGDLQVPEGVYRIDRFNPHSAFHLSLGIDYPNAADRLRAGKEDPGGEIFIHGGCATVGCLPLEDGPIEELYLAALDGPRRRIAVHIFPRRLDPDGLQALTAAHPDDDRVGFWSELAEVYAAFERDRRPPRVRIHPSTGAYRLLRR